MVEPSPNPNPPENTPNNKQKLHPEMEARKWQPGESGNPGGRPKKKPLTELYEKILNDPEQMKSLESAVIKSLKRGQMAMVLQLREMAERVEGKITQPVEVNGEIALTISERMKKAEERLKSGTGKERSRADTHR
jgi:hypothetical protein